MVEGLSIAIAGAGLMGRWHAQYARRSGGAILGVVDTRRERAEQLASGFPGARVFRCLDDLLRDCRPRVLHICTPMQSHTQIAEAALDAGANVLSEKPLASDTAAVRGLLSKAERAGLVLMPVHQFLFQRGFLRAARRLPTLGRILHLDATFCSAGGQGSAPDLLDEIVSEILPHPFSLIERLRQGSLEAIRWNAMRPLGGECRIAGAGDGISVSILVSLHGRPTESSFRIVTAGGVIEIDLFHGYAAIDTAAVSKAAKIARPFRVAASRFAAAGANLGRRFVSREFAYPGLNTLISEFYAAVRGGGPAPISPRETLAVAAARDEVLQSALLDKRRDAQ